MYMCVQLPQQPEEGVRAPGVTDSSRYPVCGLVGN